MKRVSLFIPCTVDLLLPSIGESTVSLLRRLGCDPVYHQEQTCCGLFPFNSGFREEARRLARHFIGVFGDDELVVCPSGACVNMVRNRYPELLCDYPSWLSLAESLSTRLFELSEFMVDVLGVEDVGATYEGKVAYHESCNLLNGLGISDQPKTLIRKVRGTELVPMNGSDICCGFGGEFSNTYSDISEAMVADKVRNYLESGADLLLLCEPGCLININGYLSRHHPNRKAMHMADFLAQPPPA
jgi:L-lactate dehydrogenase complex protein LldE